MIGSGGAFLDGNGYNIGIGSQLRGDGALTKQGSGILTLSGTNTYSGGTVIDNGAIIATATNALGSGTTQVNGDTSSLTFDGAGTVASSAPIFLNDSSQLTFRNGASAGESTITIAADATPSLGAGLFFSPGATAGNATIINEFAPAYSGVTFRSGSNAGSARIENRNGSVTGFQGSSSASNAMITNKEFGATLFEGSSTAGSATIINEANGQTYFWSNASGGNARVVNNSGGLVDISAINGTGTTFGSIEGRGTFQLGSKELTVGSDNRNTTVSGLIEGSAGSLAKVGTGTLTLTGANTYSRNTTIGDGTLEIQNAGALGASTVRMAGGHLRSNISGSAALPNEIRFEANQTSTLSAAPGQTLSINFGLSGYGSTIHFGTPTDTGTIIVAGSGLGYSWHGLEVNGGTLRAGSSQLPYHLIGAHTVTVTRDATLDLATYDTRISTLQGEGTLISNGPRLRISHGTFGGTLVGSAPLIKPGAGTLTLTGTSTLTGPTTVEDGALVVNGSLAASSVRVAGGTLSGTGTVGGLVVQSGATVAPGNSIGALNVAGNVSFAPGSFYALEIDDAGHSDRIAATGTATLSGGTVQILPDQGTHFVENRPYTILTARGGVSGTFGGTSGGEFAFITPTLRYGPDAVILTMVRKTGPEEPAPIDFHAVAQTRNQYTTADAVEALGAGHRLYSMVLGSSVAGARQAFDALSGEAHASAATVAYEDGRLVREAILTRLRQPMSTTLPSLAQGSYSAAYARNLPGATPQPATVTPTFDTGRLALLWGEGFGSWGKVRSNGNAASLDTSTGGFILGVDALVADSFRIGMAGGFTRTTFDIDGRLSSGSNESIFGALYGSNHGEASLSYWALRTSDMTST